MKIVILVFVDFSDFSMVYRCCSIRCWHSRCCAFKSRLYSSSVIGVFFFVGVVLLFVRDSLNGCFLFGHAPVAAVAGFDKEAGFFDLAVR